MTSPFPSPLVKQKQLRPPPPCHIRTIARCARPRGTRQRERRSRCVPDEAASHPRVHLAKEGAWKGTKIALKRERVISFRKSRRFSVRITEAKKTAFRHGENKMARVADDNKLGVVSHHKGIQVRRFLDTKIHVYHACVPLSLSALLSSEEQLAPC